MATVYLVDLTPFSPAREGVPLGWICAAEMAQCASLSVAVELWRGAVGTAAEDGNPHERAEGVDAMCADAFHLTAFPVPIVAKNRYFSAQVTAVVGSTTAGEGDWQRDLARVLQPRLNGASEGAAEPATLAYGCVFLVEEDAQSPEVVPWHLIPPSLSLFSAVLAEASTPVAVPATGAQPSATETRQRRMWKEACVSRQFEFIPWERPSASRSQPDPHPLVPVRDGVSRMGLLDESLTGSARVYQILCNTMWPPLVRTSLAEGSDRAVKANQDGKARKQNTLVVVGGGSARYMREMWGAFALPGWRLPVGFEGKGGIPLPHIMTQQDVRFAVHPSPGIRGEEGLATPVADMSPDAEMGHKMPPEAGRPPRDAAVSLQLANKYYTATVQPLFIHAALFTPATLDMLRRQLEQLDDARGEPTPALVFWPPNGGAATEDEEEESDEARGFRYPPLSTVLTQLRGTNGIGSIAVVTGARAAAVTQSTHAHERRQRSSFARAYARDRLDAVEAQQCQALVDVEVIPLLPARGVTATETRVGAEALPSCFIFRHPLAKEPAPCEVAARDCEWARVQGPSGADRLREWLTAHAWPQRQPLPTRPREQQAGLHRSNVCAFYAFGSCAEVEEHWVRHTLAHAFPAADRALKSALDGFPSITLAGLTLPMVNKYFESHVSLCMLAGGVANRLRPPRVRDGGVDTHDVIPAEVCVAIVFCSRASLSAAALASEGDGEEGEAHAFATLLRSAQARLASNWAADVADVVGDTEMGKKKKKRQGAANDARGCGDELSVLLYVTDCDAEDSDACAAVAAHLQTILFAKTGESSGDDAPEAYNGADVRFPLVEWVAMDRTSHIRAASAASCSVADAAAADEPTGCARIAEALQQHPWPAKRERVVQGVPRPAMPSPPSRTASTSGRLDESTSAALGDGKESTTRSRDSDDLSPSPADDKSAQEAAAPPHHDSSPTAVVGCALPDHFLIDPTTLRSVPVPALLFFNAKRARSDAVGEGKNAPEIQEEKVPSALAQRFHDDLFAWMDMMKVHGHKLPHSVRQQQAATLAVVMEEHIL